MNILIHKITHLPHEGLNLGKEFDGKAGERDLAEKMKKEFELVKKLCDYSITSIKHTTVSIATQILAGKVTRKCRVDEVPVPMLSLVAQCTKGMQFNWS